QVRVLVRPASDQQNLKGLDINRVAGDLDNTQQLVTQLDGADVVFHAAAHYSLWARDAASIYHVNVTGTRNILQASRSAGMKRFVFTSSVSAIGVPQRGQLANEETTTTVDALVGDYKKSKFLAEEAARRAADDGLDVVIVNPSTPLGRYDIKPTPTG